MVTPPPIFRCTWSDDALGANARKQPEGNKALTESDMYTFMIESRKPGTRSEERTFQTQPLTTTTPSWLGSGASELLKFTPAQPSLLLVLLSFFPLNNQCQQNVET